MTGPARWQFASAVTAHCFANAFGDPLAKGSADTVRLVAVEMTRCVAANWPVLIRGLRSILKPEDWQKISRAAYRSRIIGKLNIASTLITLGYGLLDNLFSLNLDPSTRSVNVFSKVATGKPERGSVGFNAVLDTNGLGPLKIGQPVTHLVNQGFLEPSTKECTGGLAESQQLESKRVRLVWFDVVEEVHLFGPAYQTRSGARVGMSLRQIRAIYGNRIKQVSKQGNGGPFPVLTVTVGDREIVFLFKNEVSNQTLPEDAKVYQITARRVSPDFFGEC
ncbi:hypothetical protein [Microlunatus sp. GCM10028923]|uniref:hypothetical protein n=1 Tax=Microlunatus sp. GCM10028923 TaxID=3273400 RepID=UPI003621F0A3